MGWTFGAWLVVVIIPALLTALPIYQYWKEVRDAKTNEDYYKTYNKEEGEFL